MGLFQLAIENRYLWVVFAMLVGSFFTLYSMIKIWGAAFWGEEKPAVENIEIKQSTRVYLASFFLVLILLTMSLDPSWLQELVLQVGREGLGR